MLDAAASAEPVEGMAAGGLAGQLVPGVDGAAVGELAAIVGEDGADRLWEVVEEALDEGDGRGSITLGEAGSSAFAEDGEPAAVTRNRRASA
jgi:hypothetical protein